MMAWLKQIFDRKNDPVYSCQQYLGKANGSCAHVDSHLCDFPSCSILADYLSSVRENNLANEKPSEG
jgi:hypothetical protein